MKYFVTVENKDLTPGFVRYLEKFYAFIVEHFDIEQSFNKRTIFEMLCDANFESDDLVEFMADHPVTENRTLHALIRYEADHFNSLAHIDAIDRLFEAEERDWLFADKENLGDAFYGHGIAGLSLGFLGINNPEINSEVTCLYYSYLWQDEWVPSDNESAEESIPEFLAMRTRINFLARGGDFHRINYNDNEFPDQLELACEKSFFESSNEYKAKVISELMTHYDLNNNPSSIRMCSKRAIEYGRCQLLRGDDIGVILYRTSSLMNLIMDSARFPEQLRERTLEIMLRRMLIPFPDAFVQAFDAVDSCGSFVLNQSDYSNGFDILSPFFKSDIGINDYWFGMYSCAHAMHQIFPKIGLEANHTGAFTENLNLMNVNVLLSYKEYYNDSFVSEFLSGWLKTLTVEKVGAYQITHLHDVIQQFQNDNEEAKCKFNHFVSKVFGSFGNAYPVSLSQIKLFLDNDHLKKSFIEYAISSENISPNIFKLSGLGYQDLKPYWDRLPSSVRKVTLDSDLSI